MELLIVADDLTGAADAAVPFAGTRETAVLVQAGASWPAAEVLAINTESRYLDERSARKSVGETLLKATVHSSVRVFKKIDSLMRGNVGVEIAATLEALSRPDRPVLAIVAPAFPRTGRTTVDGCVHVEGSRDSANIDIGKVLADVGLSHALVLRDQWTDAESLSELLRQILSARIDTVIVDALDDVDLSAIVAAAKVLGEQALLVGSGGLAARLALSMAEEDATTAPDASRRVCRAEGNTLVVIGSYAPTSAAQLNELVRAGFEHVHLDHAATGNSESINPDTTISSLQAALSRGRAVLTPDPSAPLDKKQAKKIAAALGAVVQAVHTNVSSIVISGGETAFAVLDRLDIPVLNIRGEIQPGIVAAEMPGLRQPFVTKSGAFGDVDALTSVVEYLEKPMHKATKGI
ncbi:four-carbon acid sugar kinase family protein [Paenarthrobacter sp. NPDC092416]|uniref:four-carbon acid sugar kinase family protein n=1 Tax=Paenarthrobacter sp. NPDC092416 TaxID=3364386 RepID=UPI0037F1D4EA